MTDMRDFTDREGRTWTASVGEDTRRDYKGRFYLVMRPAEMPDEAVTLTDVRWNSRRTAQRTLETMSVVELRRRLRSALGRASEPVRVPALR